MTPTRWNSVHNIQLAYEQAFLYMYAPECFVGTTQLSGCKSVSTLAAQTTVSFRARISSDVVSKAELMIFDTVDTSTRRSLPTPANFEAALKTIVHLYGYATVTVPPATAFTLAGPNVVEAGGAALIPSLLSVMIGAILCALYN